MKSIILKFSGPLQSWGTRSHFEIRHTDPYPSKSAVIGMIAAALGYKRGEDAKIQKLNELDYAVRMDQAGQIIEDFQNAHKYKNTPDPVLDRNYVTHREYIEDAVFVAAIGSEDDLWVNEIYKALQRPYYSLYEGRRSCPIMADSLLGIVDENVLSVLQSVPWQAAEWYRRRLRHISGEDAVIRIPIYADGSLILEGREVLYRRDGVLSFSEKGRKFTFRKEKMILTEVEKGDVTKRQEHDAFSALDS